MRKHLLISAAFFVALVLGASTPLLKPQLTSATAESCGYVVTLQPLEGNIGAGVKTGTEIFRHEGLTPPEYAYPKLLEFGMQDISLWTSAHTSPTIFRGMNVKLSVQPNWIVANWEMHFSVQTGDEAHPRGNLRGQAVLSIDPKYGGGPTLTELWFWLDYLEISGKGGSAKFGSARPYPNNQSYMLKGPQEETVELNNHGEFLTAQFNTPRVTPTGVIIDGMRIINAKRGMNFVVAKLILQFPPTAFTPNPACN